MTAAPLELTAIHKAYGSHEVLRGFTAAFEPGRVTAIVGPNGAGKTTLLRIAARLQGADSGSIRSGRTLYYGGAELLPIRGTVSRLRRGLGLAANDDRRKLSSLSRGELQRVGLDLAFALAPGVLLLDEPWVALDPEGRALLNDQIRAAAHDRAVVCSTHDLDEVARVADEVVLLRDGVGVRWTRESTPFERESLMRGFRSGVIA